MTLFELDVVVGLCAAAAGTLCVGGGPFGEDVASCADCSV